MKNAGLVFICALCAGANARGSTSILVSVHDQKLAVVRDGERVAEYRISTSKFGVGDKPRSYATPLGKLEIAERIGEGLPQGAVLKGRTATGEVLSANARGRDPIVTRILHLRGLESRNDNAFSRGIYIHGTPVERHLGRPDSWGCIRMRSKDVVELFDNVTVGTAVEIVDEPMREALPEMLAATRNSPPLPPVAEPPETTRANSTAVAAHSHPLPPPNDQRRLTASPSGHRLATAQDERRASERPQKMHIGLASITELRSLGGIDQLQNAKRSRDARERQSATGFSLPIW
ncbi:MAG TPA: L,D-transpeptidase [Chthoniobacteraceae bacterium]|nr:L,D-transpeptidase [Chthoniobacteraceae bacterium]